MDRHRRSHRLVTPAELATQALGSIGHGFGRVVGVVREVLGPRLAAHATATSLRNGTLTMRCTSASWAQTINMMDQDLIERLNARLGADAVTRINARAGASSTEPEAQPEAPAPPPPLGTLSTSEEQQLDELVAGISDPALRAKVLAAATATARRRKPAS